MMRQILMVTLLGAALAGCNTSYSYFEDEADPNEVKNSTLFGSMLTMAGVVEAPKQGIDYQPRPPLAIPAGADGATALPSPEEGSQAEAAVNFPTDHDELERQRRARLAELGKKAHNDDDITAKHGIGIIPADEANALRREGGGQRRTTGVAILKGHKERIFEPLTAAERDVKVSTRSRRSPILTDEGAAAPRAYLIQPPDAYRTPADTAPLPEEGDIENSEWVDKQLYRRHDYNEDPLKLR